MCGSVRHASLALSKIGHYTARFSRLLTQMIPAGGHLSGKVFGSRPGQAVSILSQQCVYPRLFVHWRATYHLSVGTWADMTAQRFSSIQCRPAGVSTITTKPDFRVDTVYEQPKEIVPMLL